MLDILGDFDELFLELPHMIPEAGIQPNQNVLNRMPLGQ